MNEIKRFTKSSGKFVSFDDHGVPNLKKSRLASLSVLLYFTPHFGIHGSTSRYIAPTWFKLNICMVVSENNRNRKIALTAP